MMGAARFTYDWRMLPIALTGMLLLCTPLAEDRMLANGLVMAKVFHFHAASAFLAVGAVPLLVSRKCRALQLTMADVLLLLFTAVTLVTYRWQLDPEPEKLLFGAQLIIVWFILRVALNSFAELRKVFLFLIVTTGLIEAVIGMAQLHGWSSSNHALFGMTGTFYNPGPYSGYLAVVAPIAFAMFLSDCRSLHYYMALCLCAIAIVLPAGMSRSAWIAAAVSCGWVYWMTGIGWRRTKMFWYRHRMKMLTATAVVCVVMVCASVALFTMKRDSAAGRALIWKIGIETVFKHPLNGVGLGGFPKAFADAQAVYFSSAVATEEEKTVADCPEYAFNEYVQIAMEQGTGGLIVFAAWIIVLCVDGIRNRQIAATGGIIALALFAFSSYPLQLPSFWILLVFTGAVCSTVPASDAVKSVNGMQKVWMLLLVSASLFLFYREREPYKAYTEWNSLQMLYENKAYRSVADDYAALHPKLKYNPRFLFEEAQCMSYSGRKHEAVEVFERATWLSADPMIYCMLAKNEQALGEYGKAEKHLLYAIRILPERIYPYYLLVKLYSDPAFYHPDKMQQAANVVLHKKPKVNSPAIKEMRNEARKCIQRMLSP
jgi:hypothetical protein